MAKAMKLKGLWLTLAAIAVLAYLFFSVTGIAVIPPRQAPPDGMTVWYYRRGTKLPFLSSPDGQKMKAETTKADTTVQLIPGADRIWIKFPFHKDLYLRTTGGVELVK